MYDMNGKSQIQGGKNWKRDKCTPDLLVLSLAGNLEKPLMSLYGTEWRERGYGLLTRVSSKRTKQISGRTETNRNKICFGCVSVCFVNQKQKIRFVSVFRTYIETTETNKTVSKQTEITQNFRKYTKICSLSNCFGWSSVCFGSIETSKLSVSV
jgi:hypothetical protein